MKYILFIVLIFTGSDAFCQKSKHYVDSLRKIISKEIPKGEDAKTIKKQIAYIRSCEALGDHYKALHKGRTALNYYLLASNLTELTDSDLWENEIPLQLRDKVCLKAGDMYFSGKNVSKNLDSALYYHFRGLRLNRDPKTSAFNRIKLRDQYSLLYFKSKAPFFTDGFPFNTNNNQSIYPVNPIYLFKSFASTLDGDNFREEIKLLNKDTTLNCLIQFNYSEILGKSMITAIGMNRFGSEVKKFMDKQVIKPERISIRDEYDGKTSAYKSWTLPSLQIMISNKSFN